MCVLKVMIFVWESKTEELSEAATLIYGAHKHKYLAQDKAF